MATTTVRAYTRAVRHPLVLGRVGGYQLPFQLTIPQLVVGALGVLAALAIRPLLADVVGARISLALVAIAVFSGVVVAKRVRAEGRNSLQALAGVVEYLTASGPRVHGRRVKTSTRRHTRWPTVVPVVDLALPPRPKELPRPAGAPPAPTIPTAQVLHATQAVPATGAVLAAPAGPRPQAVLATRAADRAASAPALPAGRGAAPAEASPPPRPRDKVAT